MNKIRSYRDLDVWKLGMELAEIVYILTKSFPKEELYGLVSQMRKCAVSIPSNIAEGSSRRTTGEFVRYVNIASGSVAELETQLMLAHKFEFISQEIADTVLLKADVVSKLLYGLQRALTEKEAA